jgi:NAD-dependent DNA ligase
VLQSISGEDAAKKIQELGADIATGKNKRTNYVIVGKEMIQQSLKKLKISTHQVQISGSFTRMNSFH